MRSLITCVFFILVSMENISTDIHELEKGFDLTKKEYNARKDSKDCPVILKDFLVNSEERFKKLLADVKTAQVKTSSLYSPYPYCGSVARCPPDVHCCLSGPLPCV